MTDLRTGSDRDDAPLRAYVLGTIDDAGRDAIEARLLTDAAFLDDLLAAEDDVFDDYARGLLPAAERARVEQRLLADTAGRSRLAFARALQQRASSPGAAAAAAAPPRPAGQTWHLAAVATAVLSLGAAGWLAFDNARLRRDVERAAAAAAPPPPSAAATAPTAPGLVADLRLSPRVVRSGGVAEVAAPRNTPVTRLLLELEDSTAPFVVAIERAGSGRVWSQADVRDRADGALVLWVPTTLLRPGSYEVLVWNGAESPSTLVAAYPFRVGG